MSDYGIKISKPGFDVKTASPENLILTSQANQYKIHIKGSLSYTSTGTKVILHGLPYTPAYIAFIKKSYNSYYNFALGGQDYVNDIYLVLGAENGDVISYIIFKDIGA